MTDTTSEEFKQHRRELSKTTRAERKAEIEEQQKRARRWFNGDY